jgi:hypothetical protein
MTAVVLYEGVEAPVCDRRSGMTVERKYLIALVRTFLVFMAAAKAQKS